MSWLFGSPATRNTNGKRNMAKGCPDGPCFDRHKARQSAVNKAEPLAPSAGFLGLKSP